MPSEKKIWHACVKCGDTGFPGLSRNTKGLKYTPHTLISACWIKNARGYLVISNVTPRGFDKHQCVRYWERDEAQSVTVWLCQTLICRNKKRTLIVSGNSWGLVCIIWHSNWYLAQVSACKFVCVYVELYDYSHGYKSASRETMIHASHTSFLFCHTLIHLLSMLGRCVWVCARCCSASYCLRLTGKERTHEIENSCTFIPPISSSRFPAYFSSFSVKSTRVWSTQS